MQIKPAHAPSAATPKAAAPRPAATPSGDFAQMLKTAQSPSSGAAGATGSSAGAAPAAAHLAPATMTGEAPSTTALAAGPLRA